MQPSQPISDGDHCHYRITYYLPIIAKKDKKLSTYLHHTCPAEFSIPTALRWPIHVHYSFSLSSMDHDFFYPHRPRRTPLQLDTYG